jgi:hypothetical protein
LATYGGYPNSANPDPNKPGSTSMDTFEKALPKEPFNATLSYSQLEHLYEEITHFKNGIRVLELCPTCKECAKVQFKSPLFENNWKVPRKTMTLCINCDELYKIPMYMSEVL